VAATEEMLSAIAGALELPSDYDLQLDSRIADVPGWDSFAWIAVITALENYCHNDLPLDRIEDARTVRDLVSVVDMLKRF
jgi:acyl carrier protein